MKKNTIENITEYAKNATVIEEPAEYSTGVKVGWTAPAKWWNWLMNAFSKRLGEIYETVKSMHEEIKNAVGGTLDENSNTQLKDKFDAIYNEKGTADGFATLDNTGILTGIQRPLAAINNLGCISSDIKKSLSYDMFPATGDFFGSTEVPVDSTAARVYYNLLFVGTGIAKYTLSKKGFPIITKIPMANSNTLRSVAGYTEDYLPYGHAGGIAVGDNGTIVDIDYDNDTVNILPSPTTENLRGVSIIPASASNLSVDTYIAVGDNGTIIINGRKIATDVTANFTAVCKNDGESAVGITADDGSAYIYNGALTKVVDATGTALRGICPSTENASSFIAAGDAGYCISFSITTQTQISGISKNIASISSMIVDQRHIYTLVGDGFAYKYTATGGFENIQNAASGLNTVVSYTREDNSTQNSFAAGYNSCIEDMLGESSATIVIDFPDKQPNWPAVENISYNCALQFTAGSDINIAVFAGNARKFLISQLTYLQTANTTNFPQLPIIVSNVEILDAYCDLDTAVNAGRYALAGKTTGNSGYIIASSFSYREHEDSWQGSVGTATITSILIVGDTLTANDKLYFGTKKESAEQINGLYRMSYSSNTHLPDTESIETLAEFASAVVKLVMFDNNLYVLTEDLKLYRYANLAVLETVMTIDTLSTTATSCYVYNDCLLITCADGHIIKYTPADYSIIDTGYAIKLNAVCVYNSLYVIACDNGTILYSSDLSTFRTIKTGDNYNLKTIANSKYHTISFDALLIAGENVNAVYAYTADDSYNLVVADTGLATIPVLKQLEKRIAALEAKG